MFISKKKYTAELERQKGAGCAELGHIIKAWHKNYELVQRKLESDFDFERVKAFDINVWDEISPDNSTYIFVDGMTHVPDKMCLAVLIHIQNYLKTHAVNDVFIKFYDSTSIHPTNLITQTGRLLSFKRWELSLENVTYETLMPIVELLKSVPDYLEKKINVYSES